MTRGDFDYGAVRRLLDEAGLGGDANAHFRPSDSPYQDFMWLQTRPDVMLMITIRLPHIREQLTRMGL